MKEFFIRIRVIIAIVALAVPLHQLVRAPSVHAKDFTDDNALERTGLLLQTSQSAEPAARTIR